MENKKRKWICAMLAVSFLLGACEKDENGGEQNGDAVVFSGVIQKNQEVTASRILTSSSWAGLTDNRVAVRIGDVVKEYKVDEEGMMTSEQPFYWENATELTVDAWYPYNDGAYSETVVVKSDQSDNNNFIASDCVEAMQGKLQKETPQLVFAHRTAKLVFKFYPTETGYTNKIVYDGLTGVENDAKEVIFNLSNEVLLAPQTLPAGKAVLRVLMNGHWIDFGVVSPDQDVELKAGVSHIFKVEVDEIEGVSITYQGDAAWNYIEETLAGNSPALTPGMDGQWGVGGNTGAITGESPILKPGSEDSQWGIEDKPAEITGESPDLKPGVGSEVEWGTVTTTLTGTVEGN
ncbi:fimbrillin family protein [Phocaeicola plebeius]|uniref:fimbrillin family protein n=1 Tax=Phocaeicola plebeius TaxID=310297 RepID=UPI0026E998A5|nr:fimbrillin family protein [Phocaeicola plebeius]